MPGQGKIELRTLKPVLGHTGRPTNRGVVFFLAAVDADEQLSESDLAELDVLGQQTAATAGADVAVGHLRETHDSDPRST